MILDYDYNKNKKQFSISYIAEDGNKQILKFENLQKFLTYFYTPQGRFKTWDDSRCDTKYTYNPHKFDLKEFIYNLNDDIQKKLDGITFPKLFTFDIETRLKSGAHGEVGMGDFTDPTVADEPIHTISLVSPNLNGVVMGDKPLTDEEIEWIKEQFYQYLKNIPFFETLELKMPQFKYMYFDKEESMLRFFLTNVVAKVPILAGWNSIGYDWCYITNRIKNTYSNLSVSDSSYTGTTRGKEFTNKRGDKIKIQHPVHTLILDMMEVVENEDTAVLPEKESLNLDYVAHETLGANKIEYEGNLEVLYNTDYKRYVFYNLIDSILVQLIDKRFKSLDHIYMYSLYAKERIGQCFSKIALTEALILKHFRSKNIKIVPEQKENVERGRLIGAYVKKPRGGLYEYVTCNDFASLYPSTMRTCNLSFENYVGVKWKEEELNKYRRDMASYIVIGPHVFRNEGTLDKPSVGEQIGSFIDWDALKPYQEDKNYFVSVNGCIYKNDRDYTLRNIMTELYSERNASKYLAKDLDAMVISDIDHILNSHLDELHQYKQNAIDLIKSLGYEFTCGEDIKQFFQKEGKDAVLEFERKLKTMITYHQNLEIAVKIMMNSVYGGTSHQSFYWFNINLANDITGESRNLTKKMEKHLTDYWKTAWTEEPKLIEIQKKLGLKLKSEEEIEEIKRNSLSNSLCYVVYGDTDSLYISYKSLLETIQGSDKMDLHQILNILMEINLNFLDQHNFDYIKAYYDKRHGQSVHKFELETINRRGVWLHETKKRYGQVLLWKDGKIYDVDSLPIKVKGLEVVKASYPTLARKQIKKLLRFLLEYNGKYLIQELNLMNMEFIKEFNVAEIDDVCANVRVNGYLDRILDDTNPNGYITTKGAAVGVRALAMYNWLNNVHHLGAEPLYGGKLKFYHVQKKSRGEREEGFAYESTKYPKWAA